MQIISVHSAEESLDAHSNYQSYGKELTEVLLIMPHRVVTTVS